MTDPLTVGSLVSIVLSMASEAALKGVVSEAVKDAYKALKQKIAHWASSDVEALERTPSSIPRRAVLAESIDSLSESDKLPLKALATELADALKKSAEEVPIGIDIERLEAARIQLGTITVEKGIGIRAKEIITPGDFELKQLSVGGTGGKATQ